MMTNHRWIVLTLLAAVACGRANPIGPTGGVLAPAASQPVTRLVTVSGAVTEIDNGPVVDASVEGFGMMATSSANGTFVLGAASVAIFGLSAPLRVNVVKDGYEPEVFTVWVSRAAGPMSVAIGLPIRRILTLANGSTLSAVLSPDDLPFVFTDAAGDHVMCVKCRKIRFAGPPDTDVKVLLSWPGSAGLRMWTLDGTVADAPNSAGPGRLLRWPIGASGVLIVGTPYPGLRSTAH